MKVLKKLMALSMAAVMIISNFNFVSANTLIMPSINLGKELVVFSGQGDSWQNNVCSSDVKIGKPIIGQDSYMDRAIYAKDVRFKNKKLNELVLKAKIIVIKVNVQDKSELSNVLRKIYKLIENNKTCKVLVVNTNKNYENFDDFKIMIRGMKLSDKNYEAYIEHMIFLSVTHKLDKELLEKLKEKFEIEDSYNNINIVNANIIKTFEKPNIILLDTTYRKTVRNLKSSRPILNPICKIIAGATICAMCSYSLYKGIIFTKKNMSNKTNTN